MPTRTRRSLLRVGGALLAGSVLAGCVGSDREAGGGTSDTTATGDRSRAASTTTATANATAPPTDATTDATTRARTPTRTETTSETGATTATQATTTAAEATASTDETTIDVPTEHRITDTHTGRNTTDVHASEDGRSTPTGEPGRETTTAWDCPPFDTGADRTVCARAGSSAGPVALTVAHPDWTVDTTDDVVEANVVTLHNASSASLRFNPHAWELHERTAGGWSSIEREAVGDGVVTVEPDTTYRWSVSRVPHPSPNVEDTAYVTADIDPGTYAFLVRVPEPTGDGRVAHLAVFRLSVA